MNYLTNYSSEHSNNLKNLDSNFFRFLLNEGILNVNLYEVPYKGWNEEGINSTAEYLQVK